MENSMAEGLKIFLGFIAGGGLLTIITAITTKKKAQRDAMREIQSAYQETIKDLRDDKELMRKENDELRESIKELREKINKISHELASIRRYKCTVVGCENRRMD